MEEVLFFDTTSSGHRFKYDLSLLKGMQKQRKVLFVTKTTDIMQNYLNEENIRFEHVKTNNKHYLLHDCSLLMQMFQISNKHKIKHIHLLYLDSLLLLLFVMLPILFILRLNVTATLHWYPVRTYKKILLKFLIRVRILKKIVVHGDYTKERVLKVIGSKHKTRVYSIPYPNLHDLTQVEFNHTKTADIELTLGQYKRPFLLVFGGMRYDKGIDILMESLKQINERDFTALIIGQEGHFNRRFIEDQLRSSGLENKVYLKLGYVPDEEVPLIFGVTDAVILPYRKVFSGQSGPLTEGVANGKFIIGPACGELGHTIQDYNLGYTFKVEDTDDLARTIEQYIVGYNSETMMINHSGVERYKLEIAEKSFWQRYQAFFLPGEQKELKIIGTDNTLTHKG